MNQSFLVLCCLILSYSLFSQDTEKYDFEVQVVDALTGEGIADVVVYMKDENGVSVHLENTTSQGKVFVFGRSPGEVLIFSFEKEGFKTPEPYKHIVARIFTENTVKVPMQQILIKSGSISGQILDKKSNIPLAEAKVKVTITSGEVINLSSDIQGRFSVKDNRLVAGSKLNIIISREGYESYKTQQILTDNELDVTLKNIFLKNVLVENEVELPTETEMENSPVIKPLLSVEGFIGLVGIVGGSMLIKNGVDTYGNEAKPIYEKYKTYTSENEFLNETPEYNFSSRAQALDEANRLKTSSNKKILLGSGAIATGVILILHKYGVIKIFKKGEKDTAQGKFELINGYSNDYALLGLRYKF